MSILNIYGLTFKYLKDTNTLQFFNSTPFSLKMFKCLIQKILHNFEKVNEKGFVPLESVTTPNEIFSLIQQFLVKEGLKIKVFAGNSNTYQLWYNFLLIHLYLLGLTMKSESILYNDELEEIDYILSDLKSRMDPFIRFKMQKRGISIVQNIYSGFDTEFELISYEKSQNKLISLQLALTTKTYLKIPLNSVQNLSYVHPLTSEITENFRPDLSD